MAKKSRRRHQPAARQAAARRAPRPVQPAAATSGAAAPYTPTTLEDVLGETEAEAPEAAEAPAAAPVAAAPAASKTEARRVGRVGRVEPAQVGARGRRGPSSGSATFPPLDPDDAAIPFDRVPYVRADLRRVAVIAGIMVVLIAIADVIVSITVK